jgi:hypothetical protein
MTGRTTRSTTPASEQVSHRACVRTRSSPPAGKTVIVGAHLLGREGRALRDWPQHVFATPGPIEPPGCCYRACWTDQLVKKEREETEPAGA